MLFAWPRGTDLMRWPQLREWEFDALITQTGITVLGVLRAIEMIDFALQAEE
jgi:hypothetical protein